MIFSTGNDVPCFQAVVVRIHTVNGNLILALRHLTLHQADLVHLLTVPEETHSTSVIQLFFYVKIFVKLYARSFDIFPLGSVNFLCCAEISVFNIVPVKAVIIASACFRLQPENRIQIRWSAPS